jgi:amidohydrolase
LAPDTACRDHSIRLRAIDWPRESLSRSPRFWRRAIANLAEGAVSIESTAAATNLISSDPAEPFSTRKALIASAIRGAAEEILDLSHRIHANPEPALEEQLAAQWIGEVLERHGFRVERPVGSLQTAVRGIMTGGLGPKGRRVGILAEYDALPGLGHGCGHNTMAASAVGAAIGLAAIAGDVLGEIVFLGTPAEERFSGKQTMIDDGLFEGLDAALLYHPTDRTQLHCNPLALEDVDVEFYGEATHASARPWAGRNALDAMTLLLVSIGLWRQQLATGRQVHGVITNAGDAPNIIPEYTRGWFNIRSETDDGLIDMERRFKALVEAAALATDCRGEVEFYGRSLTMFNNEPLLERFRCNLAAYGIVEGATSTRQGGSTDMGNVSKIVPTIHPHLAICDVGVPAHSIAFAEAAASARADETVLIAATVVAQTALDVLLDERLAAAAHAELARARGQ